MSRYKLNIDEYKIVHISDLHFTGRPEDEFASGFWRLFKSEQISLTNLRLLLADIVQEGADHIIITGDVTNTAHPEEFKKAKEWLLQLQQTLWPAAPGITELDPTRFTIIPGNHDIAHRKGWFGRRKAHRSRLDLFMTEFGPTIGIKRDNVYDYDRSFPHHKVLFDSIDIFSLDSTIDIPVHVLGFNASGEIGHPQRERLVAAFHAARHHEGRFRIVLCHHHPLIIPYRQDAAIVEDFLAMSDARSLLRACFENEIHIILHGHKHVPFIWTNEVIPELDPPHKMHVISAGSPTFERTGSSQVYNRYLAVGSALGNQARTIQTVDMRTRRYDPREQRFVDAFPKPRRLFSQQRPSEMPSDSEAFGDR